MFKNLSSIERYGLIALLLALVGSFWVNLNIVPLYLEEPRRALVAMEMILSGNYIVPTQLGELYHFKPPLFNWVLIVFYKLFGSYAEWISRGLSVVSFLGMGYLNFWFLKKYTSSKTALLSSLFFLISIDIYFYFSTTGEIDLFYSLISFASIVLTIHFYQEKKWWLFYTIPHLLAALGFLTKGFPSPIFVAATQLGLSIAFKNYKLLFKPQQFVGVGLFLLVVCPYFYAYSLQSNVWDYLQGMWGQSNDRVATSNSFVALFKHLIVFPLDTLKNLLPGSLLLILFPWRNLKTVFKNKPILKTLFWVAIINLIVYWVSPGTRARYVYMIYPLLISLITIPLLDFKTPSKEIINCRSTLSIIIMLLAAMLMLPLPFLNLTKELSLIWPITIISFALLTILALGLKRTKRHPLFWLISGFVILRFVFDLVVLPLRAEEGKIADMKEQALEMVEITQGEPIYIKERRDSYSFSLVQAYYLTREKKQMIQRIEKNCDDYFLCLKREVENTAHREFLQFDWSRFSCHLVKFEDCK